jgi:hypothetical protein
MTIITVGRPETDMIRHWYRTLDEIGHTGIENAVSLDTDDGVVRIVGVDGNEVVIGKVHQHNSMPILMPDGWEENGDEGEYLTSPEDAAGLIRQQVLTMLIPADAPVYVGGDDRTLRWAGTNDEVYSLSDTEPGGLGDIWEDIRTAVSRTWCVDVATELLNRLVEGNLPAGQDDKAHLALPGPADATVSLEGRTVRFTQGVGYLLTVHYEEDGKIRYTQAYVDYEDDVDLEDMLTFLIDPDNQKETD